MKCIRCGFTKKMQGTRKVCSACYNIARILREGKGQAPDYPHTTVEKYKEPMEKIKDGYGYLGAITSTKDGKFIQCHICGYFFGRLGSHVKAHDLTPRDYKIKFGLRIKQGLMSESAREAAQEVFNRDVRVRESRQEKLLAAAKIANPGKKAKGGNMWNPQLRNERGNCKEQTLAKIKKLAKDNGGIARSRDFEKVYGSCQTVSFWFETWQKAVEAAGLETYDKRLGRLRLVQAGKILKDIERFYKQHGRTPQFSDFRSSNKMSDPNTVRKYYGSLNEARQAAGVPRLLKVSPGVWEEKL